MPGPEEDGPPRVNVNLKGKDPTRPRVGFDSDLKRTKPELQVNTDDTAALLAEAAGQAAHRVDVNLSQESRVPRIDAAPRAEAGPPPVAAGPEVPERPDLTVDKLAEGDYGVVEEGGELFAVAAGDTRINVTDRFASGQQLDRLTVDPKNPDGGLVLTESAKIVGLTRVGIGERRGQMNVQVEVARGGKAVNVPVPLEEIGRKMNGKAWRIPTAETTPK